MGLSFGRFTINDHVGTLVRLPLLVASARGCSMPPAGLPGLLRCMSAFGLAAFEVYCWLTRLVKPPGRRLALSRGVCHVVVEGPLAEGKEGAKALPPVLLVHGFAGSHMYFKGLAMALRAAGRTVIRHDNYGRGFSSAGAGPFTASLFVDQVKDLLDQLGLEKVDLVGYSMGGAIAIAFAAAHPQRLRSLGLLAPAGMEACNKIPRVASLLCRVPGIDLLIGLIFVLGLMDKNKYGGNWELTAEGSQARLDELHAAEMRRLRVEGFMLPHAVGRTIARFPMGALTEEARSFGAAYTKGQHEVRALGIFGRHDGLVPIESLEQLKELAPHLESHIFPTAGHSFPLERPEDTAEVLLHFWAAKA